jgi:hypothetical protein
MADPPYGPSPLQMEYRNKFYVVVCSPTSAGWSWAVDVDARTVDQSRRTADRQGAGAGEAETDLGMRAAPPASAIRYSVFEFGEYSLHNSWDRNRCDLLLLAR